MVAIPYNEELLDFSPIPDALPPREEDAEEAILGCILFEPGAIHRVWHRLKPEHFQVNAHKDIYQACIRLTKKDRPTDFITVSSWLNDSNLLEKIGGRNKLMSLLDRTVSAINIDHFASLVIEKAVRKDLIKLGNEAMKLGYDTFLSIEEVLESFKRKAEVLVELETVKTEEELIKSKHDRLLDKLRKIYTTVSEPSLKYMRLKYLADEERTSIAFLESLYTKSLVTGCTKLMSYEELKEAAGSSVRQWLLQGLIPRSTSILLAADGGIGKTKLVYSIAKNIIEGTQFGDFSSTGEKRRVLFYQGDEQEGDMVQALQMLGYEEADITQYIRTRFGWSFENMAALIEDINKFKPDFVVFDSLSFGSRFSTVKEGDSEYARPILEINGLANQHKFTPLFIHHENKGGEVRGSTAIRNAVSEVWKLSKSNQPDATKYDRILEIDKSRSRSSGKRYRLYFDPDNLAFQFLGEEVLADSDVANKGTRGKIIDYFREHPNIKYTSEEIGHFLNISSGNCRRALNEISSDGLLSVERKPGKAYTYYLEFIGESRSNGSMIPFTEKQGLQTVLNGDHTQYSDRDEVIRGATPDNRKNATHSTQLQGLQPTLNGDRTQYSDRGDPIRGVTHDHLQDIYAATDTAKGDQVITNFDALKKEKENFEVAEVGSPDRLCPKASPDMNPGGDHGCDPLADQQCDRCTEYDHHSVLASTNTQTEYTENTLFPLKPIQPQRLSEPIKSLRQTVIGEVKTVAQQIDAKQWQFILILSDGTEIVKIEKLGNSKPENKLKDKLDNYLKSLTFSVFRIDGSNQWEDNCKWAETADSYNPMRSCHVFLTSDGRNITMVGIGDDRIRVKS